MNGRYYWVPFHRIRQIDIEAPCDLRDAVWLPANFIWSSGGETVGLIPTRYAGSELSDDNGVKLARKTIWQEPTANTVLGFGQRMLTTDTGDYSLMDVRKSCLTRLWNPPQRRNRRSRTMAELLLQERLQPSLLDRLTDDEPTVRQESRNKRVMSVTNLREVMLRDLGWLLNATSLGPLLDRAEHPQVSQSVINYGRPDLAGLQIRGHDLDEIEAGLLQAIRDFEPRILAHTLKVHLVLPRTRPTSAECCEFEIEGSLWCQPTPLRLFLKTAIDLETGDVKISNLGLLISTGNIRLRWHCVTSQMMIFQSQDPFTTSSLHGPKTASLLRRRIAVHARNGRRIRRCLSQDCRSSGAGNARMRRSLCRTPVGRVQFSRRPRARLKLDSQFPRFTGNLLETVYPHYMAPTPSMAVVQFQPDPAEAALATGVPVPRGTVLRSRLGKGEQTACEFRTAHDFQLWPLQIVEAEYFSRDVASLELPKIQGVRAGIRLRLQTTAGLSFDKLALDQLPVFYTAVMAICQCICMNNCWRMPWPLSCGPLQKPVVWQEVLDQSNVRSLGFKDQESLLPSVKRSFEGYRLIQEYMAFPNRFMFVEFTGLSRAVKRCTGDQLDLIVLLNRNDDVLENRVSANHFSLFCTPAINLFPKRADRVLLDPKRHEHQIIPDRTRPEDFEVHSVSAVRAYGDALSNEQEFLPFYGMTDRGDAKAFYSVRRTPRVLSERQKEQGTRSNYTGSEVYLSLVDPSEAPIRHDLRQLGVQTLCTNRDLPMHMPIGQSNSDFTLEASLPVQVIRAASVGQVSRGPLPFMWRRNWVGG